jgi:hypothetical protein
LRALGYSGATNAHALYPNVFKALDNPPLPQVLAHITAAVEKATQAATTTGMIDKFKGLAADAADYGVKMREADQEDGLIKYMRAWVSCIPLPPDSSGRAVLIVYTCTHSSK